LDMTYSWGFCMDSFQRQGQKKYVSETEAVCHMTINTKDPSVSLLYTILLI